MARTTTSHRCTECGWTSARWVGRCGQCQAWGSIVEAAPAPSGTVKSQAPAAAARPISQVASTEARAVPTGIGELDRVLGTGLVPGGVVLVGGEPGVGKSTLLLSVAARWAARGRRTLYISGEESAAQVRLRAERISAVHDELYLASENDLGTVLGHIEQLSPGLLVLDSIQTISASGIDGTSGGVAQVREVTAALVRVAKQRHMAVLIIGHVTKDGSIAGPRTLEHLVDVVLSFEGDRHSGFRMVRASKNRFGAADEVGCFEMTESGIAEVPDPSGLFTSASGTPAAGTCATVTLEGRRPLIAEAQALVAPSAVPVPRRVTQGVEAGRVALTLAVLQRKARVKLHTRDVYVSTVGGARLTDPHADLAIAIALASAASDWVPTTRVVALGEIGLSGELRRTPGTDRRLAEAARLGVGAAVVPKGALLGRAPANLVVLEAATLTEALDAYWRRLTVKELAPEVPRAWRKPVPKLRLDSAHG